MSRKIITALLLLSFIFIAGCSIPSITGSNNKPDPLQAIPEPNIEPNELTILEAIAQDKEYDKKSIVWDGEKAVIIYDQLDSRDILDGRAGPFWHEHYDTKLGISLEVADTGLNSSLFDRGQYPLTDSEEEFMVETPERYLSVIKSDPDSYGLLEDEFSKDTELMEVYEKGLSQRDYRVFAGKIKTPQGKDMIGVILITPDIDKSVFCIIYAGFGNFSDIQSEGYGMIDTFFIQN